MRKFGLDNVMILSAGWGLIPAQFLTPRYDITFSASAEPYVRRRKNQAYEDFIWLWFAAFWYALGLITPMARIYALGPDHNIIATVSEKRFAASDQRLRMDGDQIRGQQKLDALSLIGDNM